MNSEALRIRLIQGLDQHPVGPLCGDRSIRSFPCAAKAAAIAHQCGKKDLCGIARFLAGDHAFLHAGFSQLKDDPLHLPYGGVDMLHALPQKGRRLPAVQAHQDQMDLRVLPARLYADELQRCAAFVLKAGLPLARC